jgi:hypothetical protein
MMGTEIVPETSCFLSILTRLIAGEHFITSCRRESIESHIGSDLSSSRHLRPAAILFTTLSALLPFPVRTFLAGERAKRHIFTGSQTRFRQHYMVKLPIDTFSQMFCECAKKEKKEDKPAGKQNKLFVLFYCSSYLWFVC